MQGIQWRRPLSPSLRLTWEQQGEERKQEGNTFSTRTTSQELSKTDLATRLRLFDCLYSFARPHWIQSISKIFRALYYSLASIHIGSVRVFQTSFARSLMRSLGKTSKSPSPYLAIMKRAARRAAARIIS